MTDSCSGGGGVAAEEAEHPSTALFRAYLRLATVQPDPDYGPAIALLSQVSPSWIVILWIWKYSAYISDSDGLGQG